jgi:hypothetical protein
MSTSEQVLNSPFGYICSYVKIQTGTLPCVCCPNSSFTFDISDGSISITSWNFQCAQPSPSDLTGISPDTVLTNLQIIRYKSNPRFMFYKSLVDSVLSRAGQAAMSDNDYTALISAQFGSDPVRWFL